jgi:hypothetical protein
MPLCYGIFQDAGAEQWLRERFQRSFKNVEEFLVWCGQAASFGRGKAIWAVRVATAALAEFELF